MRKKVFAALLAVCMVVAMLPVSAFAEGESAELKVTLPTAGQYGEIASALNATVDQLKALNKDLKIASTGTGFAATGKANFAYFPGFSSKSDEQTGYYVPMAVDYTGKGENVEVYISSVDGSIKWEDDTTGAKFKLLLGTGESTETLVSRIDDHNQFILRIVDKGSEANTGKKEIAEMTYTDIEVDLSAVVCQNVVLDQPFMVDEKDDWDEMIKDKTFNPEETAKWTDVNESGETDRDENGTIGTYPAIAFTYAKNVVIANGNGKDNPAVAAFRYRTNTIEKLFVLKAGNNGNGLEPEETGKNYQMVELKGDLTLDETKWNDTFTITPVILKGASVGDNQWAPTGATETIVAGDSKTVSYADAEPVAKIEATNTDVFADFDAEDDTKLVAEGTVTYQDGKGYMLNLTITDDDNANTRAMQTVTLKEVADKEGAKADLTFNFEDGVAKVSFDVAADALKKAENAKPTDPDPKAGIKMVIGYGYQQKTPVKDIPLYNDTLEFTLDITAVETEVADKAIAESTTEVSVSDGAAAVSDAAVQNDLTLAIAQKRKEDGVASDATVTVPEVKLNATDAETVELGAAVLETLNKEEYAVEKVTIDNGSVVVSLPAEVIGGEEYRDEAGALALEVKEVSKSADVNDIASKLEGIERTDLAQVYNISIPTAENGVSGLTDPITLTFTINGAADYSVVYIDGTEITIVDSKASEDGKTRTAEVNHLSTYALVKTSTLIARDPSMAITVTGNEVKKGTLVPGVGTPLTAKLTGDVKAGDVAVFQIMDANGKYSVGVQVLAAGDQDILTYARGTVETVDLFILRGNTIVKSVSELTIK